MLTEVIPGNLYRSTGGYLFKVNELASHGQDCSIPMVVYTNLEPTFDSAPGNTWVSEESLFLKRFNVANENRASRSNNMPDLNIDGSGIHVFEG